MAHRCELTNAATEDYGEAISECYEREDGTLWASNTEYTNQVNFCPFCGYQAKVIATQMIMPELKNSYNLPVDERKTWEESIRKYESEVRNYHTFVIKDEALDNCGEILKRHFSIHFGIPFEEFNVLYKIFVREKKIKEELEVGKVKIRVMHCTRCQWTGKETEMKNVRYIFGIKKGCPHCKNVDEMLVEERVEWTGYYVLEERKETTDNEILSSQE